MPTVLRALYALTDNSRSSIGTSSTFFLYSSTLFLSIITPIPLNRNAYTVCSETLIPVKRNLHLLRILSNLYSIRNAIENFPI